MCDDNTPPYNNAGIRDGTNTDRVNNDQADRGRHETAQYYADCQARERNQGLFLADQDLDDDTAQYTRQNTNGDEYGYECPEERDYYPYWHPTPWKDIAIYTNRPELKCPIYAANSQNVAGKGYCSTDAQYNNQQDCEGNGQTWTVAAAHGVAAPDCLESPWSRDNHLGNTVGGNNIVYNWTIPEAAAGQQCVFRVRYNVSTEDYPSEETFADMNENEELIADNPTYNFGSEGRVISVKLALNTDQYGRTFQDRSHVFNVAARPAAAGNGKIYNLNVRGRRGNIVQTYPSVEYDFAPRDLVVGTNDFVHIQWTGSQNTPAGAGQGAENTDRSNIVQMKSANSNIPYTFAEANMFDAATEVDLATVGTGAGVNNQLDGTASYYDAGLIQPGQGVAGTYHYMCTRNNNFTNRSHKGSITVGAPAPAAN